MVIQHNMMAMNAGRQLGITDKKKAKSTEKLSSGYKINRAADDAAGLAISEKMRWQIRGLKQGKENIQDGVSVCQIMDGALTEIHEMLHRMTELSIKAANGTLTESDRSAIQEEMAQLSKEVDRTTGDTTFNEKQLLRAIDGVDFTVDKPMTTGSGRSDVIFLIDNTGSMGSYIRNVRENLEAFAKALSGCDVRYGVVEYGDISESESISYPFTNSASDVISTLKGISARGGGDGPESALEAISSALDYAFRADSTKEIILITDADYHYSGDGSTNPTTMTESDIVYALSDKNARLSVVTESLYMDQYKNKLANGDVLDITSNFYDSMLELAKGIAMGAGATIHKSPDDIYIKMSGAIGDYFTVHTYNVSAKSLGLEDISCLTQEDADQAIRQTHLALEKVSGIRAQIGAEQNALEHAYNVNYNTEENTTAAESQIRDTDMATEMVAFSNHNILSQAGQSMLAQANQSNQGVLNLLG